MGLNLKSNPHFLRALTWLEGLGASLQIQPTLPLKPGFLETFALKIQPKSFCIGLAIGSVVMLKLGAWAQRSDIYGDRVRFFQTITPERSVYPSLENLACFVRGKASTDRILVLVAGSSICLGIGQPEKEMWSNELQKKLGPSFAVVNVSFRGMSYTQAGPPLLEQLREDYSKWLFISDIGPTDTSPESLRKENTQHPYNYLAWQGIAKGILRGHKASFRRAWNELQNATSQEAIYIQEKLLSGLWENLTGASAMWNWIGYRAVFTANIFCYPPFRPLARVRDDENKEGCKPSPERFLNQQSLSMKNLTQQVDSIKTLISKTAGQNVGLDGLSKALPDEAFRRRTIFFISSWASYYVDTLPAADRFIYADFFQFRQQQLRNLGFGAVPVGLGFPYSYFVDERHFSWEAACPVAEIMAEEVRRVARREGFLP